MSVQSVAGEVNYLHKVSDEVIYMCIYCERRTDVKWGWEQPKLPYHNQEDISANLMGNVLENEK